MNVELYKYQQDIVDSVIKNNDNAPALFMRMGTGKTYTSLAIFERHMEQGRVDKLLVVCLKNKIEDWETDIAEQFPNLPKSNYEVSNFESIWRAKKAEYYKNFVTNKTLIIIDESQKIKNIKAKVTEYLLSLGELTSYKIILTGTPQNQLYIDYYPQMRFIESPVYNIPYKVWEKKYVNKILDYKGNHYFYVIQSYNHEDILKMAISQKSYYHDYASEYEKPVEIYTPIEQSSTAKRFAKDRVYQGSDGDVVADTQIALRMYMRQSLSGFISNYDIGTPKESWLEDFLEITQNNRIVIFCNFIHEIERVRDICIKMKRPHGLYYGEVKDLAPFKENEDGVAIVNYQSGAVGINDLCISNIGIFYSPCENYILFEQAKARLDRIGQTKQPIFYFLRSKNSIEGAIYNSLKRGQTFTQEIFDDWIINGRLNTD